MENIAGSQSISSNSSRKRSISKKEELPQTSNKRRLPTLHYAKKVESQISSCYNLRDSRKTAMPNKSSNKVPRVPKKLPMPESLYNYPEKEQLPLPRKKSSKVLLLKMPKPMEIPNREKFIFSIKSKFERRALDQSDFDACCSLSIKQLIEGNAKITGQVTLEDWELSAQSLINCLPAVYRRKHLKKWYSINNCYVCSLDDMLHYVMYRGIALQSTYPFSGPYRGFKSYESKHEVYTLPKNPKNTFRHCVLIVGNGRQHGTSFYEIRNTYGPHWADGGCGLIERRLFDIVLGVKGASISTLEEYYESHPSSAFVSLEGQ